MPHLSERKFRSPRLPLRGLWVVGILAGALWVTLLESAEPHIPGAGKAVFQDEPRASEAVEEDRLRDPGWLSGVQRAIALAEYAVSPSAEGPQAPNRAHGLRSYFEPTGVRVVERSVEAAPLVALRLSGIGREGRLAEVGPGSVHFEASRAEIVRPGIVEWYENSAAGLEQGFDIAERPEGAGPLVLEIRLADATGSLMQESVRLKTATGARLDYGKLQVFDAQGTRVPAHFEVPEPRRVHLVVADANFHYPLVVDPLLTGVSDTTLYGDQMSGHFGTSVAGAGDLDGDGHSDVIIGAPDYDHAGNLDAGAAFVFTGASTGIVGTEPSGADVAIYGDQAAGQFGYSVAGLGDVDGDGFGDLVVGAWGYQVGGAASPGGATFVFHGSPEGVGGGSAVLSPLDARTELGSYQVGARFGISVSGTGDVNGDGYADLIVGADSYDGLSLANEGAAFVFHGSPAGIDGLGDTAYAARITSGQQDASLGASVAGAGNVNADGYADVIVGAPDYDFLPAVDTGGGFVFLGSASGISSGSVSVASGTLDAAEAGARAGASVAGAGDVDGDGYGDVLLGAPDYTGGGLALLFAGDEYGIVLGDPGNALASFAAGQVGAGLGTSVAGVGDVDADGYADVAVGAPGYDSGLGPLQGAFFVYRGRGPGTSWPNSVADADASAIPQASEGSFGQSVAGAGDVDGDGFADVIVGAPSDWDAMTEAGAASVYHGSASGIRGPSARFAQSYLEGDALDLGLGTAVAGVGDLDGDGYSDIAIGAPGFDNGQVDEGAVFVAPGSSSGVPSGLVVGLNRWVESDEANSLLGTSVAGADVNGDGFSDLIVGVPAYDVLGNDEGAVFVFLGGQGIGAGGSVLGADLAISSDYGGSQFGQSVASAGDVNGDGYADVAIGAPGYFFAGPGIDGGVFVYLGSAAGLEGSTPSSAHAALIPEQSAAFFGQSVDGAGDLDGDGFSDLVVGAPGYDDPPNFDVGAAFVYMGSPFGIDAMLPPAVQIDSGQAGGKLGASVAGIGDIDADGFADVAVGAPYAQTGEAGLVVVSRGSETGLSPAGGITLQGSMAGANFGYSVSGAGDVNGDGYADLVVGSPGFTNGEASEGAISIFHGSEAGIQDLAEPDSRAESDRAGAELGSSVASAGDVNGDGFADVIAGAPQEVPPALGAASGAGYVMHGAGGALGRPAAAVALRGLSTPSPQAIEPWGHTYTSDRVTLSISASLPFSGGLARGEFVLCENGQSLQGVNPSCVFQASSEWTPVVPGAELKITETISGLSAGTLYRWKARIAYGPETLGVPGITPPPQLMHGPWRRPGAQFVEADFRVDVDGDGDGLADSVETNTGFYTSAYDTGTNPASVDSDGDTLPDGAETATGSFVSASDTGSDPNTADTDGDGLTDGDEVAEGTNPNDASDPAPVDQQLSVYPSARDDGLPSEALEVRGTALVPVYFANGFNGPLPGKECTAFGGSEVCNWDVLFVTTGDLVINAVDWEEPVTVVTKTLTSVEAHSQSSNTARVGPTRIATVSVSGLLGELRLYEGATEGFVGRAGAQLVFPEPSEGVLLAQASPMPWDSMAVSNTRSCGVLGNGELRCWGPGDGFNFEDPPAPSTDLTSYERVVTAASPKECALDHHGNPACWGLTGADPPARIYRDLVAGAQHRCGLYSDGTVSCWAASDGTPGVLGVIPDGPFRMLTRGGNHACGLRENATVACWPSGLAGGQADPPVLQFAAIAGGNAHTCGILADDGSVECWGSDSGGQSAPQPGPFTSISLGNEHSCGILDDGSVFCWGEGPAMVESPPTESFVQISATDDFTCGLTASGSARCWGTTTNNEAASPVSVPYPQLGVGAKHACRVGTDSALSCWTADTQPGPPAVGEFLQVESGLGFSVALGQNYTVVGFGENGSGQSAGPPGTASATQVAAGGAHACQLVPEGSLLEATASVECWGSDASGQASVPTDMDGNALSFLQVSAGDAHSCGILANGGIECWGALPAAEDHPVLNPANGQRFVQVSAGAQHNCALHANGTAHCWGDDTYGQASPPAGIFVKLAAGASHSCGLRPNASVECWGDDGSGQPTPVGEFRDIQAGGDFAAAPDGFTCGVRRNGAIHCWGKSDHGQLTAPRDEDADGVEDAADLCSEAPDADQADGDSDGAGDVCDVCPGIPDPEQNDRDDDGVGDVCDACPDNPNVWLEGEACLTSVQIGSTLPGTRSASVFFAKSTATTRVPATASFDLNLVCPSTAIGRLEMGLVLPGGLLASSVTDFGGNCAEPSFGAGGCTAGLTSTLSGNVDASQSFVIQGDNHVGFTGDATTLYFVLVGDDSSGDPELCNPAEGEVVLAQLTLLDSTPPVPSDSGVGAVGDWCNSVGPCATSPPHEFVSTLAVPAAVSDTAGSVLPAAQYSKVVGSGNEEVEVLLRPRADDPDGREWDILIRTVSERIASLVLGFIVPDTPNAKDSSLSVVSCATNTVSDLSVAPATLCGDPPHEAPAPGGTVRMSTSYVLAYNTAMGPVPAGVRSDSLYAKFDGQGFTASPPGLSLNNGDLALYQRLGTLRLGGGTGPYSGDPPIVTLEGVDSVMSPAVTTLGASSLSSADFALVGTAATGDDFDADSSMNDADNCRYAYNPDQSNLGGFNAMVSDDHGDACQCGDGDGNGGVMSADVAPLQDILSGVTTGAGEPIARCSTTGDTACNILDLVVLDAAIALVGEPFAPSVSNVCLRSVSSEDPDDP